MAAVFGIEAHYSCITGVPQALISQSNPSKLDCAEVRFEDMWWQWRGSKFLLNARASNITCRRRFTIRLLDVSSGVSNLRGSIAVAVRQRSIMLSEVGNVRYPAVVPRMELKHSEAVPNRRRHSSGRAMLTIGSLTNASPQLRSASEYSVPQDNRQTIPRASACFLSFTLEALR